MEFIRVNRNDSAAIEALAAAAAEIWTEHYTPIIGAEQTAYMIEKFQSAAAIKEQLAHGYRYDLAVENGETAGFMGYYPTDGYMYLSKLYLYKHKRGRGLSHEMVDHVAAAAREEGLSSIELNVNRHNDGSVAAYEALGFKRIREEKNDIGNGFFMDDFVYRLDMESREQ